MQRQEGSALTKYKIMQLGKDKSWPIDTAANNNALLGEGEA